MGDILFKELDIFIINDCKPTISYNYILSPLKCGLVKFEFIRKFVYTLYI